MSVPVGIPPASAPPALHKVVTPSGQSIEVMGDAERDWYQAQRDRYLSENRFTVGADLIDVERLLFLELMVFRCTRALGSGKDEYGDEISPSTAADYRRTMKENSPLISVIKNDLGMTKAQRDKAQFESVGSYIVDLKTRAREFGIHRERQLNKALSLQQDLFAIIGAYDRADETERRKLGFESDAEILQWVRTVMRPEYDAVDAHFRQNAQRTWIRSL